MRLVALYASLVAIAFWTPLAMGRHEAQPGTKWTDSEVRRAVEYFRAGRELTPSSWPGGARVAVCLTWDMDNETPDLVAGGVSPISLTRGEYGAREGLPRIMEVFDKYEIPGTFFVPGAAAMLYPELVTELKKRPRHEVGIHGWLHEIPGILDNRSEEQRLLKKALAFWTKALGKRPVGYRAPGWEFSKYTLDLIREEGFEYDSSAMSMDQPFEIVSENRPTGLVELPVSWSLDDGPYLWLPGGALPNPEQLFKVYKDDFDSAYSDGTLFLLTMHPMITGHRVPMVYLDRLIAYMKSKPGVWFATGSQIVDYVNKQQEVAVIKK